MPVVLGIPLCTVLRRRDYDRYYKVRSAAGVGHRLDRQVAADGYMTNHEREARKITVARR